MATLTLGPILMHARQVLGDGYFFSDLTDWNTLTDSKAPIDEIPQAIGAFDPGEDWPASAVISVDGFIRGSSRLAAKQMMAQLKRVRSLAALSPMTLDDEDGVWTRQVSVRRVKISDIKNQSTVNFSIDVQAPDPRMYGPSVAVSTGLPSLTGGIAFPITFPINFATTGSPGRIVTTNAGTEDTESTFEVTGGLSGGFSLIDIEDGREIRFEFPIGLGSTVFVEPSTGRAWIDNESNNLSGFLTKSEWWSVPAGGFRTIQFNGLGTVTGTPTLTARTAPAA